MTSEIDYQLKEMIESSKRMGISYREIARVTGYSSRYVQNWTQYASPKNFVDEIKVAILDLMKAKKIEVTEEVEKYETMLRKNS